MYFKYLFLLSLAVLGARADSSEDSTELTAEGAADLLKALISVGYEEDKLGLISNLAQEFSDEVENITIVGWQDVVSQGGELEQVRAVTLYLSKLGKVNQLKELEEENEEDDEDIWGKFDEIIEVFQALSSIGLPMELSFVGYDKSGVVTEKVYIDADTQYVYDDELGYLNQSYIIHNHKEIKNTIDHYSGGTLDVAVIHYDSEDKLVEKESKLVPELYVSIEDEENTTEEIIQAVIAGLGKIGLKHITEIEKIPKELALYLKSELPNYTFHVTTDINGYYINKDIYIQAEFGLTSYQVGPLEYYIFGVEKPKPKH